MSDNSIQRALLADNPNALQRKPSEEAKRLRRCRSAPRSETAEKPQENGSWLPAKELFKEMRPSFRLVAFLLFAYLLVGVIVFYLVMDQISGKLERTFVVFWIITSTIILALFFMYLAEIYTERRQKMLAKWVLTRRMTTMDLEAADLDNDRRVGAAEFVVYKLKELGKINQEDISSFLEEFNKLEVDQSGTLSAYDLTMAQSGQ